MGLNSLASEQKIVRILLFALPFIYFFPALIGKVALVQGDGWIQNIGMRVLVAKILSQGILPLWNPYEFGGMPLMATTYPGVFYPPNWLFVILPSRLQFIDRA